jgi:hypothetical protein
MTSEPATASNPTSNSDRTLLRAAVQGVYDLQHLRIAGGLRLCANFRSKLKLTEKDPEDIDAETVEAEAMKLLAQLRAEYKRLADGVASKRGRAKVKSFTGTELISTAAEAALCEMYFGLEAEERRQFAKLEALLEPFAIYRDWLKDVTGVGPAMAGVLLAYFDPAKARHVSSFWKYAGLDTGPDGAGRSRRAEHLVERTYTAKDGTEKTRMSVTYEPFLKTKLTGVLAGCFMRAGAQPWRSIYDDYKHRLETDPAREKVTIAEWKKRHKAGEDVSKLWPPGRLNNAAKRYMVKMFLVELWTRWRTLEGLPVTEPYAVAKQGRRPHAA